MTVFSRAYPAAIAVQGNKILSGICTPTTPGYPANYGMFPAGVWSLHLVTEQRQEKHLTVLGVFQLNSEFTLSTNTVVCNEYI